MSTDSKHEAFQDTPEENESAAASAEALESIEEEQTVEQKLERSLAEAADLRDKLLRVAAEFENFKKRMERERINTLKYSGEPIFRELLPVVDNLERAVTQGIVDGAAAEQNLEALLEGVRLTLKRLQGVLETFEVTPISSTGEPFDPNIQEALTMEPSETVPANHIINEFEKGYRYKDRLLRPSRVIVSSGPSS